MAKSNLKIKPVAGAVLAVVNGVTVSEVIAAYRLESDIEGKATDAFRAYIGFPTASPQHMEERWVAFNAHFAELPDNKKDAVKKLMSECRQTCAKPFTVGKDKARTIRALTEDEVAKVAERKAPKGAKTPAGTVTHSISNAEPVAPELSDVELVDHFMVLAMRILTAADLTIMERLAHAIKFGLAKKAKSAK